MISRDIAAKITALVSELRSILADSSTLSDDAEMCIIQILDEIEKEVSH